jgi:hypothetical protein
MKTQQVIFFILFALFLLGGGAFILKHEDKREVKIDAKIEALSKEIDIIKKENNIIKKKKEICDVNFQNCKENLKTCQKDKEDFFKNLNKKND